MRGAGVMGVVNNRVRTSTELGKRSVWTPKAEARGRIYDTWKAVDLAAPPAPARGPSLLPDEQKREGDGTRLCRLMGR